MALRSVCLPVRSMRCFRWREFNSSFPSKQINPAHLVGEGSLLSALPERHGRPRQADIQDMQIKPIVFERSDWQCTPRVWRNSSDFSSTQSHSTLCSDQACCKSPTERFLVTKQFANTVCTRFHRNHPLSIAGNVVSGSAGSWLRVRSSVAVKRTGPQKQNTTILLN